MNVLNIEKMTKGYGDRILFKQVTLGISQGDKIGLIGVNGTGKSTFLKIIAGIEEPDEGSVVKGGRVTVTYLPQNPVFGRDESILSYVMKNMGQEDEGFTMQSEAKKILTKLGIYDFDRDINLLSGGQKKRVALAAALVTPSDLLILDEPTNHLDSEMIMWLEEYIKKLRAQLLMVTHDRYFLDSVTNKIIEIDKTKLYTYNTNYSGFLQQKAEREDMQAATERKRQSILRAELEWMKRGCRARSTKQRARIDRYEDLKEDSKKARELMDKQPLEMGSLNTRLGKKTIELKNITKAYGDRVLIKDFTYIFLRDDRIGIIGKNGCGKSTLVKMIAEMMEPDSGTIEKGDTVRIGFFMQENQISDESINVLEHVKNIGEYLLTPEGRISASQMCEKFLFTPKMQWTPIAKLSGGEKRRLSLLSVLMQAPNVLIMDEPTNDLDIETLEIFEEYLDKFSGIIITVSHDRYFLDRIADRIFAFEDDGNIKQYEGGFSDYYEKTVLLQKEKEERANGDINSANTSKRGKESRERARKLKFTYLEQKEFEVIDDEIAALEKLIQQTEDEMIGAATDYTRLNELMKKKDEAEEQLEQKMERWMYLNDLAEKISNQN